MTDELLWQTAKPTEQSKQKILGQETDVQIKVQHIYEFKLIMRVSKSDSTMVKVFFFFLNKIEGLE